MGADDKTENKVEELRGDAKEKIGAATGDEVSRSRASATRAPRTSSRRARRSRTRSRLASQH